MPATATHAFFAEDVYLKLDLSNKDILKDNKKKFLMFAQSTDSLMFYNILNLKTGKLIRDFDHYFHKNDSREFFINLVRYIKKNNYYNDKEVLSFLYGFVCHYVLDSNAHPYVLFYTGSFIRKNKETYKYNGLHAFMESYIDNYMIRKRFSINPYGFNVSKYTFDLSEFNKNLKKVIDYSFSKTFKIDNMSKIYYVSLKQMDWILRVFRYDKYGVKKVFYKGLDLVTTKGFFKAESLSYHVKDNPKYLNNEHEKWYYPIDKSIVYNSSFDELYSKAIDEASLIINNLDKYFYKNKKIDLDKLFTNKSYITGVDCNNKNKLKYFKF